MPNPKYKANKKNGGNVPPVNDPRLLLTPIQCNKCIECMKKKGRDWQVRLSEDIRTNKNAHFVTLTLSNESYKKLHTEIWYEWERDTPYELENKIIKKAMRRFLERWRKEHKTSVRHWAVTELGHQGTENIHIHALIWTDKPKDIEKHWKYGYVFTGTFVNEQTIGYIVKYLSKMDNQHKEYKPIMLTSAGMGINYLDRTDAKDNKYKTDGTREYYTDRKGYKMALPIYYRNKIYTDEEREELWKEKLDKNERWILGQKINLTEKPEAYYPALKEARKKSKRLGYGDDQKDWDRIEYENQRKELLIKKRLEGASSGL